MSFRKAFGDGNLPFGCISQPGWGIYGLDPEVAVVAQGYAVVRDIQSRALAGDPNAGMIATYPTGNSYIHPAEKLPVADLAASFQMAVVDVLVTKSRFAAQEFKAKELVVAGGVSANQLLREMIVQDTPGKVHIPPLYLCTDNAAMIAAAGYYRFVRGQQSTLAFDALPTWPLDELA